MNIAPIIYSTIPVVIVGVLSALWRASKHRYRDADAIFVACVLPGALVLASCIIISLLP